MLAPVGKRGEDMQDFRKIKAWGRARRLVVLVFRVTSRFPRRESGGLFSQMRRAAQSIPGTIAEGAGRDSRKDFARFLVMAIASTTELENHIIQARDLRLLPERDYRELAEATGEVLRMLVAFLQRVREVN